MVKHFVTRNSFETKKLGHDFAKGLLKEKLPRQKAMILALEGELGVGKTTFLQGFAKGLGVKEKILSPTFILIRKFKIKNLKFKIFYHIDCYRIKKPKEVLDLGFKEIISNSKNIVAVEWAERIKGILPKKGITKIKFKFLGKNTRQIDIVIPKRI